MDVHTRFVIAALIGKVTGKEFTYRNCFVPGTRPSELWFTDAVFDGKEYNVVSLSDDGFIRMYLQHPLRTDPGNIDRVFEISITEIDS